MRNKVQPVQLTLDTGLVVNIHTHTKVYLLLYPIICPNPPLQSTHLLQLADQAVNILDLATALASGGFWNG